MENRKANKKWEKQVSGNRHFVGKRKLPQNTIIHFLRDYCINNTRGGCHSERNNHGKRGGRIQKGDRQQMHRCTYAACKLKERRQEKEGGRMNCLIINAVK